MGFIPPDDDAEITVDAFELMQQNVTNINGTAYTYDNFNRMKTAGNVSYEYDANGNLAKTTLPVGETTYEYDERNRVTKVENIVGGETLSSYEYAYYNNGLEAAKMDNIR